MPNSATTANEPTKFKVQTLLLKEVIMRMQTKDINFDYFKQVDEQIKSKGYTFALGMEPFRHVGLGEIQRRLKLVHRVSTQPNIRALGTSSSDLRKARKHGESLSRADYKKSARAMAETLRMMEAILLEDESIALVTLAVNEALGNASAPAADAPSAT